MWRNDCLHHLFFPTTPLVCSFTYPSHIPTPSLPYPLITQLLLEIDENEGGGPTEEHDASLTLNDHEQDLMTLQRVRRLFQGDLLALEIAIKLLIAMSQNVALQAMETNNAVTQPRNKNTSHPLTARLMTPTMTPRGGSYPYNNSGQTPRGGAAPLFTPRGSNVLVDNSSLARSNHNNNSNNNSTNGSTNYQNHNSSFSSHKTSSDSLNNLAQLADGSSVSDEAAAVTPTPTSGPFSPASYDNAGPSRSRSTTPTLTATRPTSPLTKSALFNQKEEAAEAADSLGTSPTLQQPLPQRLMSLYCYYIAIAVTAISAACSNIPSITSLPGSFRFLSEALELLVVAWRASWWPLTNTANKPQREGDSDPSLGPLASGQAPTTKMSSNVAMLLDETLRGEGRGGDAANDDGVVSAAGGGGSGAGASGGATSLRRRWVLHPVVYGSANPARLPPHACVATNSRCSQPTHQHQAGEGEDEEGFYLRDTSLVFPIFSAVITRFVLRKATWTSDRVSSLFLAMASRHGLDTPSGQVNALKLGDGINSSSSSIDDHSHGGSHINGQLYHDHYEEAVHVLRAMDARAMVLGQHNRLHEALEVYDRCANMYSVKVHGLAAEDGHAHSRNPLHQHQHQGLGDHTITMTLDIQTQSQSQAALTHPLTAALTSSDVDSLVPTTTISSLTSTNVHTDADAVTPIQAAGIVATETDTDTPAALSIQHKRLSESMIRIYGADRGAIALSRGAMWNALAGRWTRATEIAHLAESMLATLVLPGTNLLNPSAFPALRFIGTAYELTGHADKAWLLSQKAMAFSRSFSLSQNHLCMVARQTNDVFHEVCHSA